MSLLWPGLVALFEEQKNKDDSKNVSFKCLMCSPKIKFVKASISSASNLRTHVKSAHPSRLLEFNLAMENKGRKRRNDSTDDGEPKLKQMKLGEHMERPTDIQQNAVLRFVVGTSSPFSIVEHPDFVNLLKVYSGKAPPNRKVLMEKLDANFCSMKDDIKNTLKNVPYVCTTADCWTVFRRSYLGMTVHWLDPSTLERKSKALSCRRIIGRHTYDVLASEIENVLDEFEIKNKTVMMVTDNGSNFLKAFRIFGSDEVQDIHETDGDCIEEPIEITGILDKNEDFGRLPPHHSCASHTLNLIATSDADEAIKNSPTYKRTCRQVFSKCQALFNKQNHSAVAADIIKKHLGRYLPVPGATRWNSFFDALEALKSNEEHLDGLCRDLELPTFKRPQDIEFLDEYCKVMEPVATALDILQGEKAISIGFLLPTLTVVQQTLQGYSNLQFCEPLRDALLKGFDKRFAKSFKNPAYRISAILCPQFKLNWVEDEKSARADLEAEVKREATKHGIQKDTSCNQPSERPLNKNKMEDFFSKLKTASTSSIQAQDITAVAEAEVVRYLHDTNNISQLSPLLKKLYIKHNTAVPSSAHCERLFSAAGLVFDDRRGRMTDKNFECALLLKFNGCK